MTIAATTTTDEILYGYKIETNLNYLSQTDFAVWGFKLKTSETLTQ